MSPHPTDLALCACMPQSTSLENSEVLPTLLTGQNLTVFLKNDGVVISGVQTAANVTQPNISASKVTPCFQVLS